MLAVNVLAGQIPESCADQNIRREVLLRRNPGCTYHSRHPVRNKFHKRAGIFMRHDSCDRPRRRRMFRGKRRSRTPEWASAVSQERSLTACRKFQSFNHYQRIDCRLSTQKSGLALMLIVRQQPEKIESTCSAGHRIGAVVREMSIARQRVGIVREMAACVAVGGQQCCCESAERNKPRGIGKPGVCRACPQTDLIVKQGRGQGYESVLNVLRRGYIWKDLTFRSVIVARPMISPRICVRVESSRGLACLCETRRGSGEQRQHDDPDPGSFHKSLHSLSLVVRGEDGAGRDGTQDLSVLKQSLPNRRSSQGPFRHDHHIPRL